MSEVGLTLSRGRGEFQLIGFHQVLEDAITRISIATPSGNRFQRVNLGRITAQGVEAVGRVSAGPLMIGADATLQRTRGLDARGDETELEYEPAAIGRLWAEAPLIAGARVGVAAHGTGEQRFIDLDSGSLATLSPSARFDVTVSRSFELRAAGAWRRLDALVAVENLADQPVFDQAGLPQPGRTVRLQARLW